MLGLAPVIQAGHVSGSLYDLCVGMLFLCVATNISWQRRNKFVEGEEELL